MADTFCMRTPEAARYEAISTSRLIQLRMTEEGSPFIKIAARPVAYRGHRALARELHEVWLPCPRSVPRGTKQEHGFGQIKVGSTTCVERDEQRARGG
jgi:hypothetical protein